MPQAQPEAGADGRETLSTALDSYDIGEELGRGATGIVLAACHRGLGRDVAIKQLVLSASAPALRARFVSEARRLASLDHPHIVRVYDFVQLDGMCALVMQRLTGGTVHDRIERAGLSEREACAVVVAACAALHHAHDKDIVHGAINPQNVMFSAEGVVKVTDFGLANVFAREAPLGPGLDVYALGVVLYRLLCGELPSSPVSLLERPPRASVALSDVTARALHPDPGQRYATARELGAAVAHAARRKWGPGWAGETGMVLAGADVGPGRRARAGRSAGRATPASDATVTDPVALAAQAGRWAQSASEPCVPLYVAADEELVGRLESDLAGSQEQDRPRRLRLLCRLAVELHLAGRLERCPALCEQAQDVAAQIGEPWAHVLARYTRLMATWSPHDLAGRLAECDELLRAASATGDRAVAQRVRHLELRARLELGDISGADVWLDELDDTGGPWAWWQSMLLRAMRAAHEGRVDDAEALAEEALRLGRRVDADVARRCYEDQLAQYTWLSGRRGELVPALRDCVVSCPGLPLRRAALACGFAELDRTTEATAEFERLTASGLDALPRDGNWLLTMALLSFACAVVGDERRAALLYDALCPYGDRFAVAGDCTTAWGPIATALGVLASATGRFELAGEHFDDACRRATAAGATAQAILAQREHARMLLGSEDASDRDRGTFVLDDALSSARRHGLAGLGEALLQLRAGACA